MALIAEQIIESARDTHPAFDRRRNPDPVVLRALSRYVKELHGRVAAIDETALALTDTTALPLADFEAGITLPPNRYVLGVTAKDQRSTDASPILNPVDIIPYAHRHDRNQNVAAGWILNGVLYLRSPASVWKTQTEIGVAYIPDPEDLTALADELPLPTNSEGALVANVALFMARRGHTDAKLPAIDINSFVADAGKRETEYLFDVGNRQTGVRFRTRDVWP